MHFTYVSPSIKEFLGITPKEAIEEPFIGFLTPESLQKYRQFKKQLVDSILKGVQFPRKTELNLEFKHKNGSTVWTEILITIVYDNNNKFHGIVGVTRDISRRRQAEMALMKANRHLSLLSGITRHDILNKITTILGFLFLSRETKPSPDTLAYLKRIESATNEIKVLIEFTRYYENLGSSQPTWQNLTAVLGQINFPKHLTIDTNLENYSILADPMLEKVFFNLLDNSLRHGETVSKIRVFTRKNEDYLNVIWEDNGIGITEEDKDFIFERGFGKNTGLGMFLVREILSLTDITITENGKPGAGARFEISVPKGMYKKTDA